VLYVLCSISKLGDTLGGYCGISLKQVKLAVKRQHDAFANLDGFIAKFRNIWK